MFIAQRGLALVVVFSVRSAKGAKYESQGQALSNARRVAPGSQSQNNVEALKERNSYRRYFALSVLFSIDIDDPGAARLALLSACPWFSYSAPLALHLIGFRLLCKVAQRY